MCSLNNTVLLGGTSGRPLSSDTSFLQVLGEVRGHYLTP